MLQNNKIINLILKKILFDKNLTLGPFNCTTLVKLKIMHSNELCLFTPATVAQHVAHPLVVGEVIGSNLG